MLPNMSRTVVDQVFGPGGFLAARFSGYEPRPEQLRYASACFDAFASGGRLLAEGPCGVGKAFGFLAPAIWHVTEGREELLRARDAVDAERLAEAGYDEEVDPSEVPKDRVPRVLIATETIALQEQLIGKDLPALREILPWPFEFAIAKGRANFLCRDKYEDAKLDRKKRRFERFEELESWAERTEAGDLSELSWELGPLRSEVTITSDDCTRKSCPEFLGCFAERARKRVLSANVIVANYHVLFAHLAIASEFGRGILPRFDLLVMDEAHGAGDVAREFFGFRVTEGSFAHATRFLGPMPQSHRGGPDGWDIDADLRNEILARSYDLFAELKVRHSAPEYFARLTERHPGDWEPLCAKLLFASDRMQKAAVIGAESGTMPSKRQEELRRAARRCRRIREYLMIGLLPEETPDFACFLEEERGKVALRGKPIDVATTLRAKVFEQPAIHSVVATSATLATGKGAAAFDFLAEELGAESADELIVGSPFDFRAQALLVVPRGLPDPKQRAQFHEAVARQTVEVVRFARGRTLVLCTSTTAAKRVGEEIRSELGDRYAVFVQGEAPRTRLVEAFRRDVSSVLVGTRSLWTGVDVTGEALSCVVIDKLPFDPPTDPILDALSEQSRTTFNDYSVPRAAIALRQAFGRLIRSKTDRGVIVVFDRRLTDAGYGKRILAALPPAPLSRDLSDVGAFLCEREDARTEKIA